MKDWHHVSFEKKDWYSTPEIRNNPLFMIPVEIPNHRLLHQLVNAPLAPPADLIPDILGCVPSNKTLDQGEALKLTADKLADGQSAGDIGLTFADNIMKQLAVIQLPTEVAYTYHQHITEPSRLEKQGVITRTVKKEMRLDRIHDIQGLIYEGWCDIVYPDLGAGR